MICVQFYSLLYICNVPVLYLCSLLHKCNYMLTAITESSEAKDFIINWLTHSDLHDCLNSNAVEFFKVTVFLGLMHH